MSDGYRRNDNASRRLVNLALFVIFAGCLYLLLWSFPQWAGDVRGQREAAENVTQQACRDDKGQACQTMIAISAARASEHMVDLGIWQFWTSLAGIVFVALTLRETRVSVAASARAARAAESSVEDSRADAAEQAERFKQQMKTMGESVKVARESVIYRDRPWLKVTATLNSDLIFTESTVSVEMSARIENVGYGPATFIVTDWDMFASAGDAWEYMSKTTERKRVSVFEHGSVMFPQSDTTFKFDGLLPISDFMQACDKAVTDAEFSELAERSAAPCVVVGVQYAIPGDQTRRFTYMSYSILNTDREAPFFTGAPGKFRQIYLRLIENPGPVT